jgi:hypothetical protein
MSADLANAVGAFWSVPFAWMAFCLAVAAVAALFKAFGK